MNWNMPYGPKRPSTATAADRPLPLSDIVVTTPPSANNAPSPTAAAIRNMTAIDRTRLFVQGRHIDLLKTMDIQQRVTTSTWMYQFWLFSFKTAKHWGHGPRNWTATILGFDDYQQRNTIPVSSPNTPASLIGTPAAAATPMDDVMSDVSGPSTRRKPSDLCKWSIHVKETYYVETPSPTSPEPQNLDFEHEETWPRWSVSENDPRFTDKLTDGLESNLFSNIKQTDLPIAVNQIVKAAKRSSRQLDKEALGFSIMSRNDELFSSLLGKMDRTERDFALQGLHPFHLAVTYLDGAKTCCNMLDEIGIDCGTNLLRKLYINDLGHTVLDQLMMSVLKAHTSCLPVVADPEFKRERRFQGEDVDICGRWDADSSYIRTLLANGTSTVPFEWKHMFCHTSVQTIVHCIAAIFGPESAPDVNTQSGLFVRRCSHCGLKLQNKPLHTLIIVGVHLAQSGREDETLFGILACLVCLLNYGADPLLKANISVHALMGSEEADECDHVELDALELLRKLPVSLTSAWSKGIQIGWQIISKVLNHAQVEWQLLKTGDYCSRFNRSAYSTDYDEWNSEEDSEADDDDEMDVDEGARRWEHPCSAHCTERWTEHEHVKFFGKSEILAPLWASIQTELLTYRRLEAGDPWISTNFDMAGLNESLSGEGDVSIPLIEKKMMKPFCGCGRFLGATLGCAVVDEAAEPELMNFDDWSRSTYIISPEYRRDDFW